MQQRLFHTLTRRLAGLAAAGLMALGSSAVQAEVQIYNASFVNTAGGGVGLLGFGRGATRTFELGAGQDLEPGAPEGGVREFFRDLWQIDTSAIAPEVYVLQPTVIEALGTLLFTSVSFRSYDELGNLDIIDFSINAAGTQAVGGGLFTVRSSCPVQVCVWIELTGTQLLGAPLGEGYGGQVLAAPIPEPRALALMLLGMGAVGLWARRRNRAAA